MLRGKLCTAAVLSQRSIIMEEKGVQHYYYIVRPFARI
eukprot:COSAG02_NODE_6630_length_3449_cov_7.618209_3_plen_38_part_00